ncbi:MAG: outer membrane beta-barrel protein [Steroidobacteraceae bacterium]
MRPILLTVLLLSLVPSSDAADNGVYLGAGYAQSEYDLDNPLDAEPFDDEDGGIKVIAGFRPLDSFGVELSYIDHGDMTVPSGIACVQIVGVPCPDNARFGAETISGFAVGFLDFPLIDLFAKVGAASWQFDGGVPGSQAFRFDEDDLDFAWGAGAQAHFGSLGARLEYERFKVVNEDLGTISLSFIYTFL